MYIGRNNNLQEFEATQKIIFQRIDFDFSNILKQSFNQV